jgi:hypothetical protein
LRVCSLPGNRCAYQSLGPCGAVDGNNGLATRRHACEGFEDGNYLRCHNRLSNEDADEFAEPNRLYERVITIRVRKSTFAGGRNASCLGGAPDGGVSDPPDSGVGEAVLGVTAGRRCAGDEDCNSNLLICDTSSPQAICTATCTQSADQRIEAAQCGGNITTCLGDGVNFATCTRACRAMRDGEANGGCADNRVCTGLWISRANGGDRTGCYPHCQVDGDCTLQTRCNPRTGACGQPADNRKLADGEPCTGVDDCRGLCIATSTTGGTGAQCASFINLALTQLCPDDPQNIFPAWPTGDDLGICVFKSCTSNNDCTPPLSCRVAITGSLACIQP